MQGIPGSGKSTVTKGISGGPGFAKAAVFSTDDFWYDKEGVYSFDAQHLGTAHRQNQVKAENAMRVGIQSIIIDNTNIKRRDAKPYIDAARRYGYTVQVVRVTVDPQVAIDRQAHRSEDRRIPEEVIRRMYNEMEDLI